MQKALAAIALFIALCALAALCYREEIANCLQEWRRTVTFVPSARTDIAPGPATGSHFPGLRAVWQQRPVTLIDRFYGPNGVVLVILQSLDWCPYCREQLLQLQQYQAYFDAAGIGLVAITHDEPARIEPFLDSSGITIPVLWDRDSLSFRTLGLLDETYEPQDREYGTPLPGILVIDRDGIVVGKLFIRDDSLRVDSADVLAYARETLGLRAPFGAH